MFSKNFRVSVIVLNMVTSVITINRSLNWLVPKHYYSVQDQRYIGAMLMYSFSFIAMMCSYSFAAKYFIIGYERRVAFAQRSTYEHATCCSKAFLGAFKVIVFFIIVNIVKTFVVWKSCNHVADVCLRRIFMFDESFPSLFLAHITITASLLYGVKTFYDLKYRSLDIRKNGASLSEAYVVTEIMNVVDVMRLLTFAYFLVVLAGALVIFMVTTGYFMDLLHEDNTYYKAFVSFEYFLIVNYNFFSTFVMIWCFKPIRKSFLSDIACCVKIECATVEPVNNSLISDHTDIYFEQLLGNWERVLKEHG
ncbi:unnamed protein product [Bursaphelenchus okinawaensis]|uniref:Uncharacterized protein n=1 Tax=Bursaphelenchus okinawaensis TaxID=465554 RepID=A0A811LSS7_9BILA|nr:unnamed protein product [Bursaphelenchus okinawaensis]CAG9127750.1 unnamed protein product [Bursaphelenchus okinawaensis]